MPAPGARRSRAVSRRLADGIRGIILFFLHPTPARQQEKKDLQTMIVTTKALFKLAYGKYAVGAYNINNLEQTMGLFRGCIDSQAPFIIQISKGARSFTHKTMLEGLIR